MTCKPPDPTRYLGKNQKLFLRYLTKHDGKGRIPDFAEEFDVNVYSKDYQLYQVAALRLYNRGLVARVDIGDYGVYTYEITPAGVKLLAEKKP